MKKSKGGLLSNTMNAVAKRRVRMEEETGVKNTPPKKAAKRKSTGVKNKNKKGYTPPKKTEKQRKASLEAARARQSSRVSAGKKKTDAYGSYE